MVLASPRHSGPSPGTRGHSQPQEHCYPLQRLPRGRLPERSQNTSQPSSGCDRCIPSSGPAGYNSFLMTVAEDGQADVNSTED
jgi:hypothetical protein